MHFTRLALGAFMCTAIGLVAAADGPRMEDDVLNAASDQSEQQYPLIYLSDLVATKPCECSSQAYDELRQRGSDHRDCCREVGKAATIGAYFEAAPVRR
jgi:hypothetical protein